MLNEFSHGWLCNVYIWAFEKYNFTFLNIITCLIKKGFSIGKIWNSWWSIQNFLKSNFHFNCQIFSLAATTIICFIWHIGSFQLFFKICLQNNHMNNHSFSPLILSCKMVLRNHSYFKTKYDFCMCFERCLCLFPILSHSILNTCSMMCRGTKFTPQNMSLWAWELI